MFSKVKYNSRSIGACLKKIGTNTLKISVIFNLLSNFLITISFFPYETIEELLKAIFSKVKCNSRSIGACLKKIGTNTHKISDMFNLLSNFLITLSFFPYETIEEL
jgi:hypothetical protein